MRAISMKLSEVVKLEKPTYKYYKLTPNNSVRNQSTYKIARTIASLYKNLFQRLKVDEKRLVNLFGKNYLIGTKYKYQLYEKVGYFIYIEKKKVDFYLIIPETYGTIIREKLNDVWSGITIKESETLPQFRDNISMHNLVYSKEDALSLRTDLRSNELLRSNLNIVNVLNEDEKLGIYYNFVPTSQFTWRSEYKNTIDKVRANQPVDRNKGGISFVFKFILSITTDILDFILSSFEGSKESNDSVARSLAGKLNGAGEISSSTSRKENAMILDTQILIMSQSSDKLREQNNIRSLAQSFEAISEDNRLLPRQIKSSNFNYTDSYIKNAKTIKVSDYESQNFLSLAGRDILEEYNFIEKINTKETEVPEELQKGKIRIGMNEFRGSAQEAYLSDDKEYRNLTQMIIGPTRAGKSTLIANMASDMIESGECVFMFDFIKNCELSNEVAEVIPEDKVLKIRCDDPVTLQGLGYNEVGFESDTFKQYDNAKRQTTQLMTLVNSINHDDVTLTAKMERYLTSASLVVFINNGSIKDVFDVLQNHIIRRKFINKVPEAQMENMEEYINALYTLDEYDKEGNLVDSKINLIVGIIDRLNKLKANTYMEMMLKVNTDHNFDLVEEVQKNQLICLQMPEDMFSTDGERDVYTTYWITKLWLVLQIRGRKLDRSKHTKVNLIIDEIYQVENTEKFLTEKLSRLAKFSLKPIISCHYINQLKYMRNELRSANASYMLISGCDKNNYNEFKEELYPYELEDLLNLKRYHSLNLIKYRDGYAKFITKLPKPITNEKLLNKVEKSFK